MPALGSSIRNPRSESRPQSVGIAPIGDVRKLCTCQDFHHPRRDAVGAERHHAEYSAPGRQTSTKTSHQELKTMKTSKAPHLSRFAVRMMRNTHLAAGGPGPTFGCVGDSTGRMSV